MKTNELKLTPEMLLWKELGIVKCDMEFNCGGDQMNDTSFIFYDKDGKEVDDKGELETYFDNEVYKEVEFYVNSDGHYMGEAGYVHIELNEDDEDEPYFTYTKDAESEWEETMTETDYIDLTKEEVEFLQAKIESLFGGDDNGEGRNYKKDCILTDNDIKLLEGIEVKMRDFATEYKFNTDWEEMEWGFNYSTIDENEENEDLIFNENGQLLIQISKRFVKYEPSE